MEPSEKEVCGRWGGLPTVFVLALAILVATASASRAENHVALVIGNDRYVHLDSGRQLEKAVNDAEAVGDALQKDGFIVLRGMNLSRSQMVDKLYDMSALIHPGDTALFYFAGHGVSLSGGNYLIPADIPDIEEGQENRLGNQALSEADVIATLQDRGARVSVIILDACRDNPFKRPGLRSVGLDRGMTRLPEVNGVFSLYSAGYGQSALDRLSDSDTNPNSVFTRVLLPLLTKPGLNLDDLAFDVREDVARLAATTPDHHEQVPAAYNQIVGGRVYLVSASVGPGEITSAAPQEPQSDAHGTVTASLPLPNPPSPVPDAPPDPRLLALALQAELNRLGCDAGPATGDWSARSRSALERFGREQHLSLMVNSPDAATLTLLRQQTAPGCPSQVASPLAVRHAKERTRPVAERQPQRVAERRLAIRPSMHHGPVSRPAGGCFVFSGQQVCE